ncbi:transposable element Tcb2 transposase [Trichonephila clavipes]|nr:transposable element Tcb2 transposase [Trichonephila clavipes]
MPNEDRYLVLTARGHRNMNATLQQHLRSATGSRVSTQTVRNRLHGVGLYAHRPMHVLDALGRRVAGRQPPPQTLQELERALLEEWDRIPHLVINSLIDFMPQSAQRCWPSEETIPPTENDFL